LNAASFLDSLESKLRRPFESAMVAALLSPGVGGRGAAQFRLGCAITRGPVVLASRFNSYKTHPALVKLTKWPYLHAETASVLALGVNNCRGLNLFVTRITPANNIGLAKPCDVCMGLIKTTGISKIYYTMQAGYQEEII
jgi:tRNA(Arg) A34 adenosine deaminase TadA